MQVSIILKRKIDENGKYIPIGALVYELNHLHIETNSKKQGLLLVTKVKTLDNALYEPTYKLIIKSYNIAHFKEQFLRILTTAVPSFYNKYWDIIKY